MKKLFLVFFIIGLIPIAASTNIGMGNGAATQFSAFAGHSTVGDNWCACGCAACICDPGEVPIACRASAKKVNPVEENSEPASLNFSTALLGLATAFWMWLRFRAV